MKSFLTSCLILLLVLAPPAHAASGSHVLEKKIQTLTKRYEKLCPERKQKMKSCISQSKRIGNVSHQLARRQTEPSSTKVASNPVITESSRSLVEPLFDENIPTMKQKIIDLVNGERQKVGVSPLLISNAMLEMAAQGHADDMQKRDFIAHESPEGKNAKDRIEATGYLKALYDCFCSGSFTVGENIAKGQITAEEVVAGWMKSVGHRENILNAGFSEIGIGITKLNPEINVGNYNSNSYFWVQNFGTVKLRQ